MGLLLPELVRDMSVLACVFARSSVQGGAKVPEQLPWGPMGGVISASFDPRAGRLEGPSSRAQC